MRISVVLPAFNEEKLIGATLQAVHSARSAFAVIGWESEVVVCDNNSTDRTGEIARAAGAQVVFEPVNQIARARNAGAAAATGDWLIFVDADSQVSRELFADVAEVISGGRHLAGGCTVRLDHAPWWTGLFLHGWTAISLCARWAAGSFIFVEAEAFRAVGGFNQALYATEEIDLSQRLNRLARQLQLQRMRILTRHPLLTSGRKAHLYTPWEGIRFMLKTAFSLGRTLNHRDACPIWYDGRR
jgi:glycosyltransferase involved in cell wall biosynthesis